MDLPNEIRFDFISGGNNMEVEGPDGKITYLCSSSLPRSICDQASAN